MLQIISGKFFTSTARYEHDAKGVFFSNFSWVGPVKTCIGTLEPVDSYRAVSTYVFSYVNQIEREEGRGSLVRVGDPEIVRQFLLLCTLGLRAHFAADRATILTNCRSRARGSDDLFVPARFATRLFDPTIRGTADDVRRFATLVEHVIAMPRTRYEALMSALDNLDHSLRALNWNVDLAYSMLVYCLESLSQAFDDYTPEWRHYDGSVRSKLDRILATLDEEAAAAIRTTLLNASHQKLSARLVGFVEEHMGEGYYMRAGVSAPRRVPASHLRQALKNAYGLRSSYVHRLGQILEQLRIPDIAGGAIFNWQGQPFLTFDGLLQIVLEVLTNFIARSPRLEAEEFDWRRNVPGIVTFSAAPQYWIWQHDGLEDLDRAQLSKRVCAVLGGLLHHLVDVLPKRQPITDIRPLLLKYKKLAPQVPQLVRVRMLVTCVLFNALLGERQAMKGWHEFVFGKNKTHISKDSIETLVVAILLNDDIGSVGFEEGKEIYLSFREGRYGSSALDVPHVLELKLQCELANLALAEGRIHDFREFASLALTDCVDQPDAQQEIVACRDQMAPIDHAHLFRIRRSVSVDAEESPERGHAAKADAE